MARTERTQFNIRSQFARDRAAALAQRTGMTTTQVVEEALRAYLPPPLEPPTSSRLVRKGKILVMPSGGRRVSIEEVNAEIDAARDERDDAVGAS